MKRLLLLSLAVLVLVGCSQENDPGKMRFSYPRAEFSYNRADSVIVSEFREVDRSLSVGALLSMYLEGPMDSTLVNPFPQGLSIQSVWNDGHTLFITVSDHMATLSGAPLILACSCLGRTAMDISGAASADIRCESLLLDGKKSITVNADTVIYTDTIVSYENETE